MTDEQLARLLRAERIKWRLDALKRVLLAEITEVKAVATLEVKQVDMATGLVTGYGATFDVDLGKDKITPGAFSKTLETARAFARAHNSPTLFPLLWQHERTEPIGFVREAREDGRGLRCTFMLDTDSIRGRQALNGLKNGMLSFSIGYKPVKYHWEGNIRHLTEIALAEISVVTFPMNREARAEVGGGGGRGGWGGTMS